MLGDWLRITVLLGGLTCTAFFLGEYMARVFAGKNTFGSTWLLPIENFLYRLFNIDPQEEMTWREFATNFLIFLGIGIGFLLLLQKFQPFLPLNPEHLPAIGGSRALNTAVSLVTNSNWQPYRSEIVTSYLTKILGVGLENFLSAASGMAVAVALINSLVRKGGGGIGNFWVYLTRSLLYILLPLASGFALFLVWQGVPDNFNRYLHLQTLEGREQIIAQGPVASQVAIRQLGGGGGGVFTANAAHPYENPTPLTDLASILAMLLIAAAFPFMFGAMLADRAEGWMVFITMLLLFIMGLSIIWWSESQGNPLFAQLNIQDGINLEGKEVRLGVLSSATFAHVATTTSTGAANSAYASLMPLSWLVMMFNMAVGEVGFGGVGTGFINLMVYAILAMFLISWMVGKSPEFYGKRLGAYEMSMAMLVLLVPGIIQLLLTGAVVMVDGGAIGKSSTGVGKYLTEIWYLAASAARNNGSMLGGLAVDSRFYNLSTAAVMLINYLVTMLSALGLAGSLVQKVGIHRKVRFPTKNVTFVLMLVGTVVVIGSSSFLPSLVLGPVLEHLKLINWGSLV